MTAYADIPVSVSKLTATNNAYREQHYGLPVLCGRNRRVQYSLDLRDTSPLCL